MTFLEIAALTAAVVNFALALFVFWQNPKAPLHRAYFVWGMGVVFWNLSRFWMSRDISPETAVIFAKLLQFGIIIAPIGLFCTSLLIAQRPLPKWTLWLFCVLHAGFTVSLFGNQFVTGVRLVGTHGYWSVTGDLFKVYTLSYVALTIGSIVVLYRAQREAHALQKTRIRAMLLAIICVWAAGTNDMLPIHNPARYPFYPFTHIPFYPLGSMAACIYMTIVAYSVLQHTLLDVHVTLSSAYSARPR